MAALGAVDIPNRTVDDFRKTLQDREQKLVAAKKQRDIVLNDLKLANAAIDAGDKQARLRLPNLNKSNLEIGRLIVSIGHEISQSRGQLALAENQVKARALKNAQLEAAALPKDKLFALSCPDGRTVRHRHHSIEALRKELLPGYIAIGQVFAANADDTGGFVADAKSNMMDGLLQAHGDTLLAWLAERGIGKPTVVLPPNGRG
jgi:hypothetical protein